MVFGSGSKRDLELPPRPEKPDLDEHHETLYGTERHPEIGHEYRIRFIEMFLTPFVRLFSGLRGPWMLIIGGISLAFSGAIVDFVRSLINRFTGGGQ